MAMADNIVISEMTWTEVDEAMKDRPVALLPVGATEAHGPHLPLSTDTVIATEMARRGAAKLKEHGVSALILPPVNFTVADFGADFAGHHQRPRRDVDRAAARRLRRRRARSSARWPWPTSTSSRGTSECLKKAVEEAEQGGRQRLLRRHHQEALGGDCWARPSGRATTPAPSRPR